MNPVKIRDFSIGGGGPLTLLAGPCVLEEQERCLLIGGTIKEICKKYGVNYVYKSSFDKANRSSYYGFRGPGLAKGMEQLAAIKKALDVPIVTDIHNELQAKPVAEVADILQIPAFLCRQTDLLYAAAQTGRVINVKKGQFLAPADMSNVVNKLIESGTQRILLTERGATFGYNNLVVDMRSFPIMRSFGYPVVFDATHSVQLPGGCGTSSGGLRQYIPNLARAAVGAGVDALFMEIHDNPEEAKCDGPNSLYLDKLEELLEELVAIHEIVRKHQAE